MFILQAKLLAKFPGLRLIRDDILHKRNENKDCGYGCGHSEYSEGYREYSDSYSETPTPAVYSEMSEEDQEQAKRDITRFFIIVGLFGLYYIVTRHWPGFIGAFFHDIVDLFNAIINLLTAIFNLFKR